ncbi:stress response translation initiation inhibitor YciH [Orbaceae bacterium ESL0727]|nr:stress response translation initiation inhibitor YciH [Orbaceae bacterium ESL0727]
MGNPIVYSTEHGRMKAPKPVATSQQTSDLKRDGIVRIQRQVSGRKGKGVCVISGLDLDNSALLNLAAELKKRCGCGGSVKDGVIEIQGDKRDILKSLLEEKGFKVKLAGG